LFKEAKTVAGKESDRRIAEVVGVTLDVNDLELEKAFWGAALGVGIKSEVEGWAAFEVLPGFVLDLQRVSEGKVAKSRFHFDMRVRSGDYGVQRLKSLGASILEHRTYGDNEWYVMADPEGNEFCAVTRHESFAERDRD
jgi:hypothetical protein